MVAGDRVTAQALKSVSESDGMYTMLQHHAQGVASQDVLAL